MQRIFVMKQFDRPDVFHTETAVEEGGQIIDSGVQRIPCRILQHGLNS